MRYAFVLLHRWVGLTIAAFLFVAGLTGAIISWDHELDEWLNPDLHTVASRGQAIPSLDLVKAIETRDPRIRVAGVQLSVRPGEALDLFVQPRVDPGTRQLYELGFNQVFLDPVTGAEIGKREWGQVWPITRETVVSFLYKLHYSLHLPELWGIDRWGLWFMGVVAVLWTIDSFVGFYLTLPARKAPNPARPVTVERQLARGWWHRWRPAWRVKTSGSAYRITFDLHRAFSLWTWGLLFVLAFTAFSLNLYREVFLPVMSTVSQVTLSPLEKRNPTNKHRPIEPKVDYAQVLGKAHAEGEGRGWPEPVGGLGYNARYGVYSVDFFHPGDDHGAAGVGPAMLYYDGVDGRYLGDRQPWIGTAADIFVQAQFPVHSGRILGLPGRILISIMGLVVAMLSVTGVVIWWRKRVARLTRRRKGDAQASLPSAVPAE